MASTSFSLSNQLIGRNFAAAVPTPHFPGHISLRHPRRPISAGYATVERASDVVMKTGSLYEVLGIQTGATCQEIKSAYRKLARVLHPDVASSVGEDAKSASDEFMRVKAAYTTLSDPEKRALYDITLSRRRRREERLMASAFPEMNRRSRTWETDQCW